MAAVPVTNVQWAAFKPEHTYAIDEALRPVVRVSWHDAMAFCRWLNETFPWAHDVRLTTEDEWEYACRAGTETAYWSGDNEEHLARVGWYWDNSDRRLHRVGEKEANPWGLYDMHGNVREWTATAKGSYRVYRGGSWSTHAQYVRAAYCQRHAPSHRGNDLGFRLARGQAAFMPGAET
jgi:formylglycine-generating enzyme required for sulfatase activity